MQKMTDGSARIPDGTYVRVRRVGSTEQEFIGQVVGTDMWGSKYEVGARCGGWLFLDGGSWAFPSWVTPMSEDEALAIQDEPRD